MTPHIPTPDQAHAAEIVAAKREGYVLYCQEWHHFDDGQRNYAAAHRYPWPEYDVTGTPPTEWPVEGEEGVRVAIDVGAYYEIRFCDGSANSLCNTPARRRAAIALLQAQDAPPTRRVRVRWEHGAAVAEEVAG